MWRPPDLKRKTTNQLNCLNVVQLIELKKWKVIGIMGCIHTCYVPKRTLWTRCKLLAQDVMIESVHTTNFDIFASFSHHMTYISRKKKSCDVPSTCILFGGFVWYIRIVDATWNDTLPRYIGHDVRMRKICQH